MSNTKTYRSSKITPVSRINNTVCIDAEKKGNEYFCNNCCIVIISYEYAITQHENTSGDKNKQWITLYEKRPRAIFEEKISITKNTLYISYGQLLFTYYLSPFNALISSLSSAAFS